MIIYTIKRDKIDSRQNIYNRVCVLISEEIVLKIRFSCSGALNGGGMANPPLLLVLHELMLDHDLSLGSRLGRAALNGESMCILMALPEVPTFPPPASPRRMPLSRSSAPPSSPPSPPLDEASDLFRLNLRPTSPGL